jgi:cytidine deaminase
MSKQNKSQNPKLWGPGMWKFLHTISFAYPNKPTEDEKMYHLQFMLNLQYIIPCGKCRQNYISNLYDLEINVNHFKNKTTFSTFVFDLHNMVNKELGKKIQTDFQKIKRQYI